MWATSQGDRILTGREASLLLQAIGYLRDMITVGVEIDEPHQTDVAIFNILQPTQQLAVLHEVAFALLDPRTPMLELNAVREATVYVLFRELLSLVEVEIDLTRRKGTPHCEIRSAILAAFVEEAPFSGVWDGGEWDDRLELNHDVLTAESTLGQDLSPNLEDLQRWYCILESLADQILWDRDFELESVFADRDPAKVETVKQAMGIKSNYFSIPAPDATTREYEEMDRELIELTSSRRSIFEPVVKSNTERVDGDSEIRF